MPMPSPAWSLMTWAGRCRHWVLATSAVQRSAAGLIGSARVTAAPSHAGGRADEPDPGADAGAGSYLGGWMIPAGFLNLGVLRGGSQIARRCGGEVPADDLRQPGEVGVDAPGGLAGGDRQAGGVQREVPGDR